MMHKETGKYIGNSKTALMVKTRQCLICGVKKQTINQVSVRMWRKWNPCSLLVGMQNGTAAVENGILALPKVKVEFPYNPAIYLLNIYPQN